MYVTTDAVESFVEDHYQFQINKLKTGVVSREDGKDLGAAGGSGAGSRGRGGGADESIAEGKGKQQQQHTYHVSADADAALLAILEHCCEEEVQHRDEARERAGSVW